MTDATHHRDASIEHATLIETEVLLPAPKRFVRERLEMPDGYRLDWYYVDTPPSVMVVPVTSDGSLILVRQYRHNLRRHTLEFPAGAARRDEGLDLAARRELKEETGYVLGSGATLQSLGAFSSLPSETTKYTHMYLAQQVIPDGPAQWDTEIERYFDMSITQMPLSEVVAAIGVAVVGTETITALTLAQEALT